MIHSHLIACHNVVERQWARWTRPEEIPCSPVRFVLAEAARRNKRYDLKPGYRRFVARVGPEERSWRGSVVAKVYLDGNLVDESPVLRAGDPPWNIDVAIRARPMARAPRQIRLVLTDGGDGNHSDWGEWVEAGFIIRKD